jgi:hypothetical protein
MRVAKTGVKVKPVACAFMRLRAKSSRPLMRFSEKSSETTCLMWAMLTLLSEDTGGRLSQSVPRETFVFGTAAMMFRGSLEGVQQCRGHVHTAGA